jgi:flagellar motor switch protein FliM
MQTESRKKRATQAPTDAAPGPGTGRNEPARYDLLRTDRIPQPQLRAIQQLHENLARSLASSISAYLRSFVSITVASFEQMSYSDFVQRLPAKTLAAGLSLKPYEGCGVLEVGPSFFFPALETLLGGAGLSSKPVDREITDIEQRLMDGFLRIVVQHLRDVWKPIAPIEFAIQEIEKEPQFLQVLSATEAVIAVGMEVRLGAAIGAMNIAIPSLLIRLLRQRFDQQWAARRPESSTDEQRRMLQLVGPATADVEICLDGAALSVRRLADLAEGDLLLLDLPVERALAGLVNGDRRLEGHIARSGRHCLFVIDGVAEEGGLG